MAHEEEVYTVDEFARRVGLHRTTLYRLIERGEAPRPRDQGGRRIYTTEDLRAYLVLVGRWRPGPFAVPRRGPDALDEDETDDA